MRKIAILHEKAKFAQKLRLARSRFSSGTVRSLCYEKLSALPVFNMVPSNLNKASSASWETAMLVNQS